MVDSFGFNDGIEQQEEDNRIRQYLSELNNRTNDPEEMMLEIMEVLNETVEPIPEVGKFYTFVYNAKTPGESYDNSMWFNEMNLMTFSIYPMVNTYSILAK